MTIGFIFWLLMILWLVFGFYTNRAAVGPWLAKGELFLFVLLLLLGIQTFGWPLKT